MQIRLLQVLHFLHVRANISNSSKGKCFPHGLLPSCLSLLYCCCKSLVIMETSVHFSWHLPFWKRILLTHIFHVYLRTLRALLDQPREVHVVLWSKRCSQKITQAPHSNWYSKTNNFWTRRLRVSMTFLRIWLKERETFLAFSYWWYLSPNQLTTSVCGFLCRG